MCVRIAVIAAAAALCPLAGAQSIKLTQISTTFNTPVGIDYHEPTNSVIISANYSSGLPHNLERIEFDGAHVPYSSLAGLTDELKIATVRSSGNPGGFVVGDVFTGNGQVGQIVRVSNGGATVQNPWVTLPGGDGLMRGSLYIDRTGVWGGDLVVCTTGGQLWRVDNAGNPTLLNDVNTHLEGLCTVPNDVAKYGPLAGKAIAGAESQGLLYAFATDGSVASFNVGVAIEDIDFLDGGGFFGVNFGTGRILAAPASTFAGMAGDLLLTQENVAGSGLYLLRWNGASLVATQFALAAGSEVPGQWEHVTIAPVGIVPFPSCEISASSPLAASAGVAVSFTVTGKDANAADTVTVSVSGLPAGATLTPPLPASGNPVVATFDWTPGPAQVGTHVLHFDVTDSGGLSVGCDVTIEVAECFLALGATQAALPLGPGGDLLYTVPIALYPVTMTSIPVFPIPSDASLVGIHVYSQILMRNPLMFPSDPVKASAGMDVTIGGWMTHYGADSGMAQWLAAGPNPGGELKILFAISP